MRLQEVLKQPQYSPIELEDQVAILFAATNGYLDDVPVNSVSQWRSDFWEFLRSAHPEVRQMIYDNRLDKKFPPPDVKNALEDAIKEFKQTSTYSE
jgi:F-type H+-transporting ATPase subunit alpha